MTEVPQSQKILFDKTLQEAYDRLSIHITDCYERKIDKMGYLDRSEVLTYRMDAVREYQLGFYYRDLLFLVQHALRRQLDAVGGFDNTSKDHICADPKVWIAAIQLLTNESARSVNGRR